jgi:hypothetical protein
VDSVHKLWTSAGRGPWWTEDTRGGDGSPELLLIAGSGHGSSPRERENGAGDVPVSTLGEWRRRDDVVGQAIE